MALPIQRCWCRLRAMTLPWPAAGYHAKPVPLNLSGVYIPDPADPKTKAWQKGPAFEAKLYGRYGSASGVSPERLWPSPEELQRIEGEEKEWYPSLGEMLSRVEAKEREEQKIKQERENLIAANMAKMPKMVEDWRKGKREARQKEKEEKAKKQRLLLVAREKFGVTVDPRSPKFLEMMKDLEKDEKRKLKAVKRMQREEERAAIAAAFTVKPPADSDSGSPV
ncbi:large ribosomal subunit protein mL64 [Lithobates pipiens]